MDKDVRRNPYRPSSPRTNSLPNSGRKPQMEMQYSLDSLIPQEPTEEETHVFSVSELNNNIKQILEGHFPLLWLKGEISNFKAHTSGHFYFSLKDNKAQINAVMFRGFNTRLKFKPEDGQEVMVRGRITVYEPRGNYQIFCELMEPVGAGALQLAYEQLKAKLQKEGLFDQARKRPIPHLPAHVAIVTSPTGAAVRDMLNVLGRRFKGLRITIIPALVQGEKAAPSIAEAIGLANRLTDVDVMIVGRGGGSIEDLWAFNEELVVRAISNARVPVISAVGHEVDFTIADFVADLRAPTPSAAAELVCKNGADLIEKVNVSHRRLNNSFRIFVERAQKKIESLAARLVDPQRNLQDLMIRCDELASRLELAVSRDLKSRAMGVELLKRKMGTPSSQVDQGRHDLKVLRMRLTTSAQKRTEKKQSDLARMVALLNSLSPLKVLERGYSIVESQGSIVTNADAVAVGDDVKLRLAKGELFAKITKKV